MLRGGSRDPPSSGRPLAGAWAAAKQRAGGGAEGAEAGSAAEVGSGKSPRLGSWQIGTTWVPGSPPPVLPRCSQLSSGRARGPPGPGGVCRPSRAPAAPPPGSRVRPARMPGAGRPADRGQRGVGSARQRGREHRGGLRGGNRSCEEPARVSGRRAWGGWARGLGSLSRVLDRAGLGLRGGGGGAGRGGAGPRCTAPACGVGRPPRVQPRSPPLCSAPRCRWGGDSRHRGEGLLSLIHPTRHIPSVAHTPGRGRTPRSCLGTSSLDEATGTHTHNHGLWSSHQIHKPGHLYTHPGHSVGSTQSQHPSWIKSAIL